MHGPLDNRPFRRLPGLVTALFGAGLLFATAPLAAQTLNGSPASLDRQNAQARAHNFSILQNSAQVMRFVEAGYLVRVSPNSDFDLHLVSYPYARPAVKLFIERFASQYRSACGEKLVVTSLTRPVSEQPANASSRSVHPTGMAVDLRRSGSARCRNWLESTLLSLKSQGVLEVIYERNPPHYHLALFPDPYMDYLAKRGAPVATFASTASNPQAEGGAAGGTHRVGRGETLSQIAVEYGVTVAALRAANGLRSDRILAGQKLTIPVGGSAQVMAEAEPSATPDVFANVSRTTPAAATDAGGTITHTVSSGESLWEISRNYGVSENAIRAANGISGSRILAGQRLNIPAGGEGGGTLEYTVKRGDSLWVIASRLGTTVDEIRHTNGMDTTRIYAGQVLIVPISR